MRIDDIYFQCLGVFVENDVKLPTIATLWRCNTSNMELAKAVHPLFVCVSMGFAGWLIIYVEQTSR